MSELLEEASGLEATTIGIFRSSATVKGGRRFSFGALVVVGNRNGTVGLGYAKAPGVPAAIEKAQKYARKEMKRVNLQEGTLPHAIKGRFGASSVQLVPASAGTGVIAGGTVRAVLELAGVKDCLTKAVGSTSQLNLAKAVMLGLTGLQSKQTIADLRGVEIGKTIVEEKLDAGRRFAPAPSLRPAAPRPKREEKRGGRGGPGGKSRGGRGGGGGGGRARQDRPAAAAEPKPEAQAETQPPAPESSGESQA